MIKPKVVIIDDDTAIAQMYLDKFRHDGFDAFVASDGQTGIALALRERPAVILLDIMMPNMNGIELLTRLHNYPEIKDSKIIIITNVDRADTMQEVLSLGAIDWVVKSNTTPEGLSDRVQKLLDMLPPDEATNHPTAG